MNKVIIQIHRVLGSVLAILFVMWFATGFVMIYHNFPKMQDSLQRKGLLPIQVSADSLQIGLSRLPQGRPDSLVLRMISPTNFVFVYSKDGQTVLYPNQGKVRSSYTIGEIDLYAQRAIQAPITEVDTLWNLDRWIPYDKHKAQMPILVYHYNDGKGSEMYVSKVTGEGVQFSTSKDRFYAWVGAIPHWLYILDLRFYRDTWANVVIVLSGLGALMCLSGLILGVVAYVKRYRKKGDFRSMYPKGFFRWHHVMGFFFGIFVFTFSFSGMMSLQKIPQWLQTTHRPELADLVQDRSLKRQPSEFPLSLVELMEQLKGTDIRRVAFRQWGDKPYYQVLTADSTIFVDASGDRVAPLNLSEQEVRAWIERLHPGEEYSLDVMTEYDNYYIHKKQNLPLPVFHIQVKDADKTSYYIEPKTGSVRYFNANTRMRKWTYQALHSFTIKGLVGHSFWWNLLMFTAMIGGSIVSVTGIVLAYRYLFGKKKRKK